MSDSDNDDEIVQDQFSNHQDRSRGSAQPAQQRPTFPEHDGPRVWFITAGSSPIALELTKRLLEHGDFVACGMLQSELDESEERRLAFEDLVNAHGVEGTGVGVGNGNQQGLRAIGFDIRSAADCQSAVAEAVEAFGRIDILLCCHSEALIGTMEELAQSPATISLITSQMQTNFYGPVNIVKACLPAMRSRRNGHIIVLTGITGHLGTPSLSPLCSSQWALEGYIDSIAYEIAPFNIRTSILQSNVEVGLLTNKIISVPPIAAYQPPQNRAPLARQWVASICDRLALAARKPQGFGYGRTTIADPSLAGRPSAEIASSLMLPSELLNGPNIATFQPALPPGFLSPLIAETLHALMAVSGHLNPPARHIVGHEGVASVKEKLRALSEEMEEFLAASLGVDF